MYTLASIQEKLSSIDGFIEVLDESVLHIGHVGYKEGKVTHIKVRIESRSDITKIALHRLVYSTLKEEIEQGLHAIAIESVVV